MPRTTRRPLKLKFLPAIPLEPEFAIIGGGTHNEGSAFTFTITCSDAGVVYVTGEAISVQLGAQPTPSPAGTWTQGNSLVAISAGVDALNAATPGSAVLSGNSVIFYMNVWNKTFAWTRNSINVPGAQGNFSGYASIEEVSRGTINGTGQAAFTITDLGTTPTGLTDFTFNTVETINGFPTFTMPFNTPNNTALATSVQGTGAAVTTMAFATGGDAEAYFKLVGLLPFSNNLLDWEQYPLPPIPSGFGIGGEAGKASYYITLVANGTLEKKFRVNYELPINEATGGTNTPQTGISPDIHVYSNYKNFCSNQTSGRQLVIDPSVIGFTANGGLNGGGGWSGNGLANPATVNNITIRGHKRIILNKGGGILYMKGDNILLADCAFRPGGDTDGYNYEDRDGCNVHSATNVWFLHCSFSWSIDESVSFIGKERNPRHVRMTYCLIAQALILAGHPKGSHSFGTGQIRTIDGCYDKNLYLGMTQRSPWLANSRGSVVQNNIIARYGPNQLNGGISIVGDNDGPGVLKKGPKYENTVRIEGNLVQDLGPAGRANAIRAFCCTGAGQDGSKIYLPEGTTYDNHFFALDATMGGVPNLAADPLTRAANVNLNIVGFGGVPSEPECLVSDPPFKTLMVNERMPTATLANRQALWADVMNNVGVRRHSDNNYYPGITGMTEIDAEIVEHFLATGNVIPAYGQFPNGPPPAAAVPSAATYDFTKTGLPPGAPAW